MGTSYAEWLVHPGVELWQSVTTAAGDRESPEQLRILPDGCLDLIFDGERLLVAGPDSTARVHQRVGSATVTGLRFHAGRGPALLNVAADEVRDRTLPLDDLWGSGPARRLGGPVAQAPLRVLGSWAVERLHAADLDPFGRRVHRLLAAGRAVAEVADELGYSTRQLHRRSLPVFGYGPQQLRRVLRLQQAVAVADSGLAWATVAQRAGYVDQAHLAREFRALTGTTPARLRQERDVRSVQDGDRTAPLASSA